MVVLGDGVGGVMCLRVIRVKVAGGGWNGVLPVGVLLQRQVRVIGVGGGVGGILPDKVIVAGGG